ncbi:MAG: iron-containing alcohol dehydrogenase, partial [Acetobacteraceae bacterium]
MSIASLVAPRLMLIGPGSLARLPEMLARLGLSRPLVVSDPFLAESGLLERALAPLRAAGLAPGLFTDTVPDPTDRVVEAGVAVLRAGDFDCLIGFGGGSPMDTAKAMAILAAAPEGTHIRAFKVPAEADRAALPLICVPTSAGTANLLTRSTAILGTAFFV